jgi:hypothetical protein
MVRRALMNANVDDFIDDISEMERLPRRRGVETSRHFPGNTTDQGDEPDDFTKATTEELYEKLIRQRNDVYKHLLSR